VKPNTPYDSGTPFDASLAGAPAPPAGNGADGLHATHSANGRASNGVGSYPTPVYLPADLLPTSLPDDGSDAGGIDVRQLLGVLIRRRILIALTLLVVVIAGVLYTSTLKHIYAASATVLVNPSTRNSSQSDLPAISDIVEANRGRSLETQIQIFNSGPVVQQAIHHLNPADAATIAQYLNFSVAPVRGTDVLAISVETYTPHAASAFANAVCDAYIQQNKSQNQEQLRSATNYVQGQLAKVLDRLNKARANLQRYKQAHNTVDLQAESEARIKEVGIIQDDLRTAQTEYTATAAQLGELRAEAAGMAPSETVPSAIVRRPAVLLMDQQLTKLEFDRLTAIQEYTRQSPEVKSIEGQIAGIRSQLQREAQTEISGWQRTPNPVRLVVVQSIATLQGQLWAQQARAQALRAALAGAQAQLAQLPQHEYNLGQLTTDVASQQQTYQMLRERFETLRISQNMAVANVRMLTPATPPGAPVRPNRTQNIKLSVILGLILAIALALLVERLDDRVVSEEIAERVTKRPALAFVPFFEDNTRQSLLTDTHQNSPLLESYRMLRNNISFAAVDQPIRSLMLTSSQPNEGKSSTCVNLAVVMAMDGKRVVLVDCDLRRPSLHNLFGLSNRIGFTSVLAGSASLSEALQDTSVPGLQVLTSGPIPPNPPELLNSQASQACLNQIMQQADFVIIDTPPALAISDAQVIATKVDAALLIISCREANQHAVARTAQLLAQTGTRILGCVLNKLTAGFGGEYGYYGGYYRSSYYKYYKSYFDASEEGQTAPSATATDTKPKARL